MTLTRSVNLVSDSKQFLLTQKHRKSGRPPFLQDYQSSTTERPQSRPELDNRTRFEFASTIQRRALTSHTPRYELVSAN